MSRIGKVPITLPEGVKFFSDVSGISVTGKKGTLALRLPTEVQIELVDGRLELKPSSETKRARAMWGLSRTLVFNMVKGVSEGFTKSLEISGIGYKASIDDKILILSLGYSHEIMYQIPDDIEIKAEKPTLLHISGIDNQKVGEVAAKIRKMRKPEPYKGKGVKYVGEKILRKEGKKK